MPLKGGRGMRGAGVPAPEGAEEVAEGAGATTVVVEGAAVATATSAAMTESFRYIIAVGEGGVVEVAEGCWLL